MNGMPAIHTLALQPLKYPVHDKPLEQLRWHADVLKVMIWHTPAGIIDEGGKALEGFINFNITLMSAPENDRMTVSATLALPASWSSCSA